MLFEVVTLSPHKGIKTRVVQPKINFEGYASLQLQSWSKQYLSGQITQTGMS